jgi:hypothetical protein
MPVSVQKAQGFFSILVKSSKVLGINMSSKSENYDRLDIWFFVFGLYFAIWHIIPVCLTLEIKNKLIMGDLFDISTPFVLVAIILKLWQLIKNGNCMPTSGSKVSWLYRGLLYFGVIAFIQGHGIHLASNTIGRHFIEGENSSVFKLVYFFDETLSHILWDSGFVLISLALIIKALFIEARLNKIQINLFLCFGALFYGFTYFCNGIEGQTVIFTLPFALIIPLSLLVISLLSHNLNVKHPVVVFYLIAFMTANVLFMVWGITFSGFPEFSELGWIRSSIP